MDKDFILMSKKASGLQDEWIPSEGDIVVTVDGDLLTVVDAGEGKTISLIKKVDNSGCCALNGTVCSKEFITLDRDDLIWLPRQEQLQNLLGTPSDQLLNDLIDFSTNFNTEEYKPDMMEKWWFLYYMDFINDLEWKDGEWC
ncbi:MAG: hypothetical protein CR982_01080 [Candidatus Cloacimonadota bacterium]|nr:MAG: hypothetical protein CR982_01080 [Candidatus Cloacimonadota bacterium]PIE78129.1 MAG: hypothetical protein CSA15_09400 [Candidatus Delongbacteria bacterium]